LFWNSKQILIPAIHVADRAAVLAVQVARHGSGILAQYDVRIGGHFWDEMGARKGMNGGEAASGYNHFHSEATGFQTDFYLAFAPLHIGYCDALIKQLD
jgi:hypothetical protein